MAVALITPLFQTGLFLINLILALSSSHTELLLNMAAPENTKMTHLHYIAKGISHPSKALNSGVPVTSMGQIASTNVCESTGCYQEPGTSVVP